MHFNSFAYLIFFLPIALTVYFKLNKHKYTAAGQTFLTLASLFFYGFWNWWYLPLILFSIGFNFMVGKKLAASHKEPRPAHTRLLLTLGISTNLAVLGYYKYADFFITNINQIFLANFDTLNLALPLAISFFTFQQVAYLVDSAKGLTKEYDFQRYCLFVTFFPQLIAGPIVHHAEMMPQFERKRAKLIHWNNLFLGITILIVGLFKKVVIADTLAIRVAQGFDEGSLLNFSQAWCSALSFTFQIYFDFSGYCDMAIGSALMFNIKLPENFNSPYKATNIQDFWRRWHITLSTWLRDYLYIPLGGSKRSELITYRNLFITFLLGGLWHKAAWTYIIWGALHGFATCTQRLVGKLGLKIPKAVGWLMTFLFIVITWVFFRAQDLDAAIKIIQAMISQHGFSTQYGSEPTSLSAWTNLIILLFVVLLAPTTKQLAKNHKPNIFYMIIFTAMFIWVAFSFNNFSEFLYFNF